MPVSATYRRPQQALFTQGLFRFPPMTDYYQVSVRDALNLVSTILNKLHIPHEYRAAMTLIAVADTVGQAPNEIVRSVAKYLRCHDSEFNLEKIVHGRAAMLTLRMYRDDGVFNLEWECSQTRIDIMKRILYPDTAHPDLQSDELWELFVRDNEEQKAKGIPF
jgi:hypothetical protein